MNLQEKEVVITKNFIDLEGVISSKNPRLLKVIPKFIINYLKRVTHQDELNATIWRNRDSYGLDFVRNILAEFGAKIHVKGIDHIGENKRWLFASNHPLGGLDGMAFIQAVGEVHKNIVFPVNDLLLNVPNLRQLFIPINKHGSNSDNVRLIEDTFAGDQVVLYFPAGLCSRKQKGLGIYDLEWKKAFISKARQYQRDIIPTHIEGQNSQWFYNLARFRKSIGIKANVEMLYLVDEMYRQKDKDITITFGKPIPYTTFDQRFTDKIWAQKVKEHVYALTQNPEKVFSI